MNLEGSKDVICPNVILKTVHIKFINDWAGEIAQYLRTRSAIVEVLSTHLEWPTIPCISNSSRSYILFSIPWVLALTSAQTHTEMLMYIHNLKKFKNNVS